MPNRLSALPRELACATSGQRLQTRTLNDWPLPATLLCGAASGPNLLLTAGVHGCEYCSIQACLELVRELDPRELAGNILIVPVANMSGFYDRLPALVAEDGKNLNRVFPGSADGSFSEQLALLITSLQDWADFYVDLHGGDLHEAMHPFVFVPGVAEPEVTECARAAARCLDVDVRVLSGATTGAYNSAALRGTPSLLIERGGLGRWSRAEVDAYKKDLYALLRHLTILPGTPASQSPGTDSAGPADRQRECTRPVYLEAECRGFWYPACGIEPGAPVHKGQTLGVVRDLSGAPLQEYRAEQDGMVLYMTVSLAVKEATPLVAYG